jgi:hypothetical protein
VPKWIRYNASWLNGVLTAGVACLTAFGFRMSGDQVAAITSFIAAFTGGAIHIDAVVNPPK